MITRSLEDKFLKYMYDRHLAVHSSGSGNLRDSLLYITSGPGIEKVIPEILIRNYDGQKNVIKYRVVEVAVELQKKGFVEFSEDNAEFWLTDEGRKRAARGWFWYHRQIEYLNNNPGLAIIVSIVALIISIIAIITSAKG